MTMGTNAIATPTSPIRSADQTQMERVEHHGQDHRPKHDGKKGQGDPTADVEQKSHKADLQRQVEGPRTPRP